MANVFISYAREDKPRAKLLTEALEAEGFEVWWDSDLTPGGRYRKVIEEQLGLADCVIVVWTEAARESDWVQDEAEEGRRRGVLVPIVLDHVRPPAGFRQLQSADLSDWGGDAGHPEFRGLIFAVRSLVQVARATSRNEPPVVAPAQSHPVLEPAPPLETPTEPPQISAPAPAPPPPPKPPPDPAPLAPLAEPTPTPPQARPPEPDPLPAATVTPHPPEPAPGPAAPSRTFAWPWWAALTVIAVVLVLNGSGLSSQPALLLLICAAPILAGVMAVVGRQRGLATGVPRTINWIALAAGALAVVVVQLSHTRLSRLLPFDGAVFLAAGSFAFAAAMGVVLAIRPSERSPSASAATPASAAPPARRGVSALAFSWPFWAVAAAIMAVAVGILAGLDEIQVALVFSLAPLAAGAIALVCGRVGVGPRSQATAVWVGAIVGIVATIVTLISNHDFGGRWPIMAAFVFDFSGSIAFALVALVALGLRLARR